MEDEHRSVTVRETFPTDFQDGEEGPRAKAQRWPLKPKTKEENSLPKAFWKLCDPTDT